MVGAGCGVDEETVKDRITQNTGTHNIALIMISLICVGAVVESISQGWEFWVPPLVIICLIMSWVIHVIQYGQSTFRENFYMIFSMVVFCPCMLGFRL